MFINLPMYRLTCLFVLICFAFTSKNETRAWIRINQLGYKPASVKVAVWCSKAGNTIKAFQLIDAVTKKFVYSATAGKAFSAYGPFKQTYRLNFSSFKKPGRYYLQAGSVKSPEFNIAEDVYKGTADFCLRYMRQQRSGFNPFLKDSCHTHDGYTMYGPMPDSTHIDVSGGWHDASDYLQYVATSANATYHLLMAYRDFPKVFSDQHQANGLEGSNGRADVLDEARWGLDWLLKMHPRDDWMFNQIADDRDHMGMRIPKKDSFYGKGYERPIYFITGDPQGLFKYKNRTTGTSSTAAKFCSAFGLGFQLFDSLDKEYASFLMDKAVSAMDYANIKQGVTQTAPGRAPYFYEEDNWTDDVELGYAIAAQSMNKMLASVNISLDQFPMGNFLLDSSYLYAKKERVTPWLGSDTAKHYQWYPFINIGHYELAKQLQGKDLQEILSYYRLGIERVWNKAKQNAFYRGVPFIWCSNNLTTSFAIQCYWYRQLTNDRTFEQLEQANFDWLFGCNPWGTSMIYGLPAWGDTPVDPHSAFTHLKNYPIDGGLVDGPVYGSIYKKLIGITLYQPDEYAEFQSDLAVYHDDYGDYSTNEPTMDGTASLIYLLAAMEAAAPSKSPPVGETFKHSDKNLTLSSRKKATSSSNQKRVSGKQQRSSEFYQTPSTGGGRGSLYGAVIRGDTAQKKLAIVFTGDEFGEGGPTILKTLWEHNAKASFFLTGRFYSNPAFKNLILQLRQHGHYLGAHSDQHLLYCDWSKRDSLLVTKEQFTTDLEKNYEAMKIFGVSKANARYFLPPYEWYNDSISEWTRQKGLQLINYTPGTLSHADYTTPDEKNYRSSEAILQSVYSYERNPGLNGFILLMHIGTHPGRTDKLYMRLPELLSSLKEEGYQLVRIDTLLD